MEKKDQMLTYNLTATGSDSLYESLYKCIKNDILQGKLCAGEKLPSKRSFAKNLGISVITVENAYGQLSDEGYIYSMPKRGFYVSDIDMVAARGINMNGMSQSADRNISDDNYIYGMESFYTLLTVFDQIENGNFSQPIEFDFRSMKIFSLLFEFIFFMLFSFLKFCL